MGTRKGRISLVQAICAVIIPIACFLPWVSGGFGGQEEGSLSLVQSAWKGAELLGYLDFGVATNDLQNLLSGYMLTVYLFAVFALVNVFVQWTSHVPIAAFYCNGLALLSCVGWMMAAERLGIGMWHMGIGFYIALVATLVSLIAAWFSISLNFYRNRGFMIVATVITALSLGLMPWKSHLLFSVIGYFHLPFVVLGWLVVLVTRGSQRKARLSARYSRGSMYGSGYSSGRDGRRRRTMTTVGGAVAALLVAVGGYFVWHIPRVADGKEEVKAEEEQTEVAIQDTPAAPQPAAPSAASAPASDIKKVRIKATSVNLRQAPSTESPRLVIAHDGQAEIVYWSDQPQNVLQPRGFHLDEAVVEVVGESGEWYCISVATPSGTFRPYLMKRFTEDVE